MCDKRGLWWLLLWFVYANPATTKQPARTPNRYPPFVRFSLAGVHVVDGAGRKVHDPQQGYYLIATGNCDISSLELILTPDPQDWGYDPKDAFLQKDIKRGVLPRLYGGAGVNIGETPQQVVRSLGSRPHFTAYHRKQGVRIYTYFAHILMAGRGRQLSSAKYIFKQERLRSIAYGVSNEDGCG